MNISKAVDLIVSKLVSWMQGFIHMLPNIAVAALIIVLGFFVAKKFLKLISIGISKVISSKIVANLLSNIIYIFMLGTIIFVALSVLKLDEVVVSLLAGAGILGLGLAFAFQDIAANFISGIFISIRKPIHIGDIVKIKDHMGKVTEINLRDTVIQNFEGQIIIIPNKDVFQNAIENYSFLGKRRMDLTIGVSYGDDLEKVKKITLEAVKGIDHTTDDEVTFYYHEFGDSSISFTVRIWVNTSEQSYYWYVRNEAIIRIKKAFEANEISIPFPIRTLDFGIKGGRSLAEIDLHVIQQEKRGE